MAAYFLASAALVISVGAAIYLFFFIKKRTSESFISQKNRAEVAGLINDIDRVTDRDLELIEDRANKLRSLLSEIDKHILVYSNNIKRIEESALAIKKSKTEKQNAAESSYRKAGKFVNIKPQQDDGGTSELFQNQNEKPSTEAGPPSMQTEHLPQVAARMEAAGVPKQEIAKRLGITVAEVDMALFVSKQK